MEEAIVASLCETLHVIQIKYPSSQNSLVQSGVCKSKYWSGESSPKYCSNKMHLPNTTETSRKVQRLVIWGYMSLEWELYCPPLCTCFWRLYVVQREYTVIKCFNNISFEFNPYTSKCLTDTILSQEEFIWGMCRRKDSQFNFLCSYEYKYLRLEMPKKCHKVSKAATIDFLFLKVQMTVTMMLAPCFFTVVRKILTRSNWYATLPPVQFRVALHHNTMQKCDIWAYWLVFFKSIKHHHT